MLGLLFFINDLDDEMTSKLFFADNEKLIGRVASEGDVERPRADLLIHDPGWQKTIGSMLLTEPPLG